MLNVKFTSEQRTALKTEIANRMKAQPTAVPGFQSHTATKAELIEAAVKLGIDVSDYGTAGWETQPHVSPSHARPPRPCSRWPRRSRCWTGQRTAVSMRPQTG